MNKRKLTYTVLIMISAIILVDQLVKFLVKTHMFIGEDIPLIGEWCRLHFVENEGFAFGTSFGGVTGKYILTLFRIVASVAIGWYVTRLIRKGGRTSLTLSLSCILAGAIGNIIDCLFYGLIFGESYYTVASLFPPEGGYAPLMQGKVVDMFYFPLFEGVFPQWMPFVGGNHFEFFSAIFNFADSAITIGVIWLIIDLLLNEKSRSADSADEKKYNFKQLIARFKEKK